MAQNKVSAELIFPEQSRSTSQERRERVTYLYAVRSSFCLDTSTLLGFDELLVYENDPFNQKSCNRTRGQDSKKKPLGLPLGPISSGSFGSGFKDDSSGDASLSYPWRLSCINV